jgi:hypothetical protein
MTRGAFTLIKKGLKPFIRRLLSTASTNAGQQMWSIGIYAGESPFQFAAPENIDNPVLTGRDVSDVPAVSVADPFMLCVDHTWYMFFEVINMTTAKGEIGLAISPNGLQWTYQQIVLAEPFHLSYPYVFEWMNDYYMIPESTQAGSIRLYKATKFPIRWSLAGILMSGGYFADTSIFRHNDRWWLFTETNPSIMHDTLRLFYATELRGPWLEHRNSPIVKGNPHIARPGGRVLTINDRIIRYTQDCYPLYGIQVRAFEITNLTTISYIEQDANESIKVLIPSGGGWNADGMHHIDPHMIGDKRWIASVDGWHYGYMDIISRLKTSISKIISRD